MYDVNREYDYDTNLGPDRLEGPKALDPDNQSFDCTTSVWKS